MGMGWGWPPYGPPVATGGRRTYPPAPSLQGRGVRVVIGGHMAMDCGLRRNDGLGGGLDSRFRGNDGCADQRGLPRPGRGVVR